MCSCLFAGLTAARINLKFGMHTLIGSDCAIDYIILTFEVIKGNFRSNKFLWQVPFTFFPALRYNLPHTTIPYLLLKLKLKFISQVMIHIIQLKYMFKNSPCRTPKKGVNAQAKFGDLLTYT